MAARFENRVLESSTSTGADSFALQAVAGWRRFADALAVGETCHYVITATDSVGRATGEAEWGIGTIAANNMLVRTTVIGSSNGGARVAFAEGTKTVALTALAPVTAVLQADWRAAVGLDKVDNTSDKLKPASDATKAALDTKVAKAGDEMSGNLLLHSNAPYMTLSKTGANSAAALVGQKNKVNRWSLEMASNSAETGGNSGSHFSVNRFSDAGAYIDTPLALDRSNGSVTVNSLSSKGSITTQPSTPSFHISMTGQFADGPNWYVPMIVASPGFQMQLQAYHIPGNWAGFRFVLGTTSATVYEFRSSGTAYSPGGWTTFSDRRLKTNVKPIEGAWDGIDSIEGCSYDRPDLKNSITGKTPRMAGLIAQDVQKVVPWSVTGQESDAEYLSLDYNGPIAYLVQFARAAKAKVVAQQVLIDDLVTRLEALERR